MQRLSTSFLRRVPAMRHAALLAFASRGLMAPRALAPALATPIKISPKTA